MQQSFLVVFVLNVLHISSGYGPDHSGTKYVLGFLPNEYQSQCSLHVYISSSKSYDVNVRVYTPLREGFHLESIIKFGQTIHVEFNKSMTFYGTDYNTNAIVIEADDDLIVYGNNRWKYTTDGFLALPLDVLGKEYYVVAWDNYIYDKHNYTSRNIALIISTQNDTDVVIRFPKNGYVYVKFNGTEYRQNSILRISLHEYQTFQIYSYDGGLTSTHVLSSKAVAVFSGNDISKVGPDGYADHLCEQLLPVDRWGKSCFMTSAPGRVTGHDYFVIHTSEINTNINITGNVAGNSYFESLHLSNIGAFTYHYVPNSALKVSSDKAIMGYQFIGGYSDDSCDPSMILLPSIPDFSSDYVFEFPKQSATEDYENYFTFIIKTNEVNGLLLNENPLNPDQLIIISGTDFVSGYKKISPGRHIIRHLSPIVIFQGVIIGSKTWESYGFPIGLRLSTLNADCQKSPQVAGDLLDNDCDGKIDEEICEESVLSVDDDADGAVDEDCAIDFFTKQKGCRPGPADILFLVDISISQSNGISEANNLMKYFINVLPLNRNDFQVAILTYGFEYLINCNFSTDQNHLLTVIEGINSTNGPTFTGKALDFAHKFLQTSLFGSRLHGTAKQIIILITDGLSSDRNMAISAAQILRSSSILLYAVGTGSEIAHDELLALARDKEYMFGSLHTKELLNSILKHTSLTLCSDCQQESSSQVILSILNSQDYTTAGINKKRFLMKQFVRLLVSYNKNVSLALVLSARESKTLFSLRNNISLACIDELDFNIHSFVQPSINGNFTEGILHIQRDILDNIIFSNNNTVIVTFIQNSLDEIDEVRSLISKYSNISFVFVATNVDEYDNSNISSTGTHPYNIFLIDDAANDVDKLYAIAAQTLHNNCDKMLGKL